MTDEEFIFRQTAAERKRNGRGDFNKKRQGGRVVRFPSDNLTAKERAMLNSSVSTFNMAAPISWKAFREWPDDLKTGYIRQLEEKYNASTGDIARMMGISEYTLQELRKALGCPAKRGGRRKPLDKAGWAAFTTGTKAAESPAAEKRENAGRETLQKCDAPTKIELGDDSILNLAILLNALKGSGAKLTIEVTL